ncbi:alpha/beta hydrolase fold domain-containing protein [Nonomuraea sp. FMUSA5-5]|uniref:Alpha/beta hydrolase fold domain-containing protein n=1 Tax=Nonomuraea composti TaxID=2720023 RepID=A0ABX1BEG3_9ACTN|nr:cellulose binding domain-containing protein [Nonomuraea sp. FMUSA5-5]NJP94940.1 alpha/beta hydrolase fold domain-containing protein [Nonomuraea sp. FMUSA5-5]
MQARIPRAVIVGMAMTVLAALGVSAASMPPAHAAQVITDIAYAPAQPSGSRGHLLDLYLPSTGITPRPLLIWHSGSAWTSDNGKEGADEIAAVFNPLGFAVAGVSVRSSGQATFPAQVHDIKGAIRWLRANAATYQLDPNRFAIMGDSSGGWLTEMATFSGGVTALEGTVGTTGVSSNVQAGLAFYSPTDFLQMNAQNLPTGGLDHNSPASPESLLVGCPIQTCPDKVAQANPMTYVDAGDPPLLFLHGQADFLVPHGQSVLLYNRIKAQCGTGTFVSVPGADHMKVQIMDPAHYGTETVRTTTGCGETVGTGTLNATWANFATFLRGGLKLGTSCEVTYSTGVWNGAFNGSVVIRNTGTTPISGWTVTWTWSGNQQITSAWNATVTQTGAQVVARDAGHNSYIGPGSSQSLGFSATATGTNDIPAQFKVNNLACTRVPA